MKKYYLAFLLFTLCLTGCNSCRNDYKHWVSDKFGLERHVVLYNANGETIKEWDTTSKIEYNGSTCYFISDGKVVSISGTYIVEEK